MQQQKNAAAFIQDIIDDLIRLKEMWITWTSTWEWGELKELFFFFECSPICTSLDCILVVQILSIYICPNSPLGHCRRTPGQHQGAAERCSGGLHKSAHRWKSEFGPRLGSVWIAASLFSYWDAGRRRVHTDLWMKLKSISSLDIWTI